MKFFGEVNANELLSLAINGEIDNKGILKNIINIFIEELIPYIKSMRNNTFNNSNT